VRNAPPVSVCCAGTVWIHVQAALNALAAAVAGTWLAQHAGVSGLPLALLAGAEAAAVFALTLWAGRGPVRRLAWDGNAWTLDGDEVDAAVMLDLGRWLLLRLRRAAGGSDWLAVTASECGAAFHGLRAALYSRPS
jgi:hypothetical protein